MKPHSSEVINKESDTTSYRLKVVHDKLFLRPEGPRKRESIHTGSHRRVCVSCPYIFASEVTPYNTPEITTMRCHYLSNWQLTMSKSSVADITSKSEHITFTRDTSFSTYINKVLSKVTVQPTWVSAARNDLNCG